MGQRRGCKCDHAQGELVFDTSATSELASVARVAERIATSVEELRFVGVTDERTECERCGRVELDGSCSDSRQPGCR